MKIAVIADSLLKEELMAQGPGEDVHPIWLQAPQPVDGANAYIDLLFTPENNRINELKKIRQVPVIINSVADTLTGLPSNFVRINGWNSLLKRPVTEAAGTDANTKTGAEKVLAAFGKSTSWVPDSPGFIAARVISMIINEAYLSLDEKVSTKEEIDTAMKLGTNYPYGPFEWGKIIGLKKVNDLLLKLAELNTRYTPSLLLQKEAFDL